MNVTPDTRSTLDKYLPVLFVGKALKKTMWSLFAMYMALHCSGIHPFR